MSGVRRVVVLAAVAMAVAGVLTARWAGRAAQGQVGSTASPKAVPRLVDLGADKCTSCRAMLPVLDQLRAEYAGRLDVQFIDVWKQPQAAEPFMVRLIPTQIFIGGDGRELARHEGFISKADIVAQWKALGVTL